MERITMIRINGKDYGIAGGVPIKGVDYFTEEDIAMIVNTVLDRIGQPKIGYVTLLADKWVGESSPYSQVVEVQGITANSQIDLNPSVEQLDIFHGKDLAFVAENDGGIVTVYAVGQKPTNDYTIQATIKEVVV